MSKAVCGGIVKNGVAPQIATLTVYIKSNKLLILICVCNEIFIFVKSGTKTDKLAQGQISKVPLDLLFPLFLVCTRSINICLMASE